MLIHYAAMRGEERIVEHLIKVHNFDVDVRGQLGRTALHSAAFDGQTECVKTLIECGANVEMRDHNNNTPLHFA